MRAYENQVWCAVDDGGESIAYSATPAYSGSELLPRGVTISAQGNGGFYLFVTVLNRTRP